MQHVAYDIVTVTVWYLQCTRVNGVQVQVFTCLACESGIQNSFDYISCTKQLQPGLYCWFFWGEGGGAFHTYSNGVKHLENFKSVDSLVM